MCGSSAQSCGTHWVNSENTWVPSGLSVLSSVVGITPSRTARSAGRPSRASMERPLDELHGRRHLDRAGEVLGHVADVRRRGEVRAARSSARLIFTTPERVFHRSMSVTKSSGSCFSPTWSRNAVRGCSVVTTTGAVISSPDASTTPVDPAAVGRDLLDARRTCGSRAPKDSAARRIAAETAPIPPSGKPQEPSWPSPTSPIEWCAMTYAVPGSYGPAQVPMTPLTASAPLICGDSNQSSSRSAMLIVISRVRSAMVRRSTPRLRPREPGEVGEVAGGVRPDVGRHLHQQRRHDVGQPGQPRVPLARRRGVLERDTARSPRDCGPGRPRAA